MATVQKKKPSKKARDVPEVLKPYNIRVSTPYGMYPDDVAVLVETMKNQLSQLEVSHASLKKELEVVIQSKKSVEVELENIKQEFAKMKMEITLADIPINSSFEDDLFQLGTGVQSIKGQKSPKRLKL